ncbi:MAG: GNAT family N-acetyltransferase [Actinomycetota bacterium]
MNAAPLVLDIPDVAGEGWRLRPWRREDAASLSRAWHDPAVIGGSTPPDDRSEPAAARWIAGCEERRLAGVALDVVIAGPADDVLGEFGLSQLDAVRRAAVAGWWLHEEARGRGLGTSVVTAVVGALLDGPLGAVLAEIDETNTASAAVATRAGFRPLADPRNPQETARRASPRAWYVAISTVKRVP